MKLSRLIIGFLAVALFSGSYAVARGGHRDHKHGRDEMGMEKQFSLERLKDLDLSKEQREKLKELRQAHKDDTEKLREEVKEAKKSFKTVLRSNASKEEVLKAFENMLEKKSKVGKARIQGLLEAREILTPEQRAKLFDKDE